MKNIFIATDFSAPSYNAALFGAELARMSGARLILFHAYYPAVLLEEETIWAAEEMLEKEVQEKLDLLAHELHRTYQISVTRIMKPGFAVDEMLAVNKKARAGLIIVGTEGAGIRKKSGYGKVCLEILKKADAPVVCVPINVTVADMERLVVNRENEITLGNEKGMEAFLYLLNKYSKAMIRKLA